MNEQNQLADSFVPSARGGNAAINFPDPRTFRFEPHVYAENDEFYYFTEVLHFGGELTVENLRRAYSLGAFPWAVGGCPTPWYCPEQRAIIEFAELHVPRSLRIARRKTDFVCTIDRAFERVIKSCASIGRKARADALESRGDAEIEAPELDYGTWITPEFIEAFINLHRAGGAHSVEVWDARGELVGGLYGVDAGGVFCGESMFHLRSNASKFAFLHLVEHLAVRGAMWLDVQMMTPHFAALGAKEIARQEFLGKLEKTFQLHLQLF